MYVNKDVRRGITGVVPLDTKLICTDPKDTRRGINRDVPLDSKLWVRKEHVLRTWTCPFNSITGGKRDNCVTLHMGLCVLCTVDCEETSNSEHDN